MLKVDFYNLDEIKDEDLSFAVISAIHNGKWVFTKHKQRDTWETPGGKRNKNESIDECASRELIEETGANKFNLIPLCVYSVEKEDKKDFGQIYYSEVDNFNELPDFEMEKIEFFDKLPDKLTHPLIESLIFKKVLEILKRNNKIKFTALFVKDREDLLKRFPPKHDKIFADHSTIEFRPENLNDIEIGKELSIKIIGRAYDKFGDDLLVENPKSKNEYPHITLSRGVNAPPLYSKELFKKAIESNTIEYFTNENVVVIEGYSDSKEYFIKPI